MDDNLLAEARRAEERLIDAERDAEIARAEFNRAVRRLHLQGSSLRELAATLGLSHQRIHQIVAEAGGSRRWVRRRDTRPDPLRACTFCGSPQNKVRKLIAGPGAHICDRCVEAAETVIGSGQPASTQVGPITAVPEQQKQARCSFCGKYRPTVAGLAMVSAKSIGQPPATATICTECLELCDEINREELLPD